MERINNADPKAAPMGGRAGVRNGRCGQGPVEKPWGQTVAYVRAIEGSLIELCSPLGG